RDRPAALSRPRPGLSDASHPAPRELGLPTGPGGDPGAALPDHRRRGARQPLPDGRPDRVLRVRVSFLALRAALMGFAEVNPEDVAALRAGKRGRPTC